MAHEQLPDPGDRQANNLAFSTLIAPHIHAVATSRMSSWWVEGRFGGGRNAEALDAFIRNMWTTPEQFEMHVRWHNNRRGGDHPTG